MKRFILIITVVCVASLSFVLFTGCPTAPTDPYYVTFKIDGVAKNFNKGFTNYESNPFGNEIADTYTLFVATPDDETGEAEPYNYIWIDFDGVDTDTYPITFPNTDLSLDLAIEGSGASSSDVTMQVTVYGAVGETIEGTFSGSLDDGSTITEGEFRVLRAPDNTFGGAG